MLDFSFEGVLDLLSFVDFLPPSANDDKLLFFVTVCVDKFGLCFLCTCFAIVGSSTGFFLSFEDVFPFLALLCLSVLLISCTPFSGGLILFFFFSFEASSLSSTCFLFDFLLEDK